MRRPRRSTLFPYTTLFRSADFLLDPFHPGAINRIGVVPEPLMVALAGQLNVSLGQERMRSRRSEEHTSELQSQSNLVCRLLLEKKKDLLARKQCLVFRPGC